MVCYSFVRKYFKKEWRKKKKVRETHDVNPQEESNQSMVSISGSPYYNSRRFSSSFKENDSREKI